MKQTIYFQSSLPRSGSTLLQNILGQNPQFYVTPTSGLIDLIGASRQVYVNNPNFKAQDSNQMRNAFLAYCNFAMEGYFKGLTTKPYIVDKSRGWAMNYDFLAQFIDKPKIIMIVRDLRDVYASMEKKFKANPNQALTQVDANKNFMVTKESRFEHWSKTTPVGTKIEQIFACLQSGTIQNFCVVKYENLCKNPQQVMNKIYAYLGLDSYKHNFNKIKQVTVEDDKFHGIYGDHKIKEKLKFVESNHEQILGKALSDSIVKNYEWFYKYFNYGN